MKLRLGRIERYVLIQDPMRAAMDNGTLVSSRAGVHPASAGYQQIGDAMWAVMKYIG